MSAEKALYNEEQLKNLQEKPLEEKIQISSSRIMEWYSYWEGQVYVSFSGGKDSTVLLDLVRRIYPDCLAVYIDTGLEFPEIREFVKTFDNIKWIYPEKYNRHTRSYERYNFTQILKDYGYPIISKEQASYISEFKHSSSDKLKKIRLDGNKYGMGKISKKWRFLLDEKCDFNISEKCCNYMKKNPANKFEKESGLKPIIGVMAQESSQRKSNWKKYGCNAFEKTRPTSNPISFWTEQDILHYIKKYNLKYCPIYGDLIEIKSDEGNETLHFTGYQRTGCVFCGYGCHLGTPPNRFQLLAVSHPSLYKYCIDGGEYNKDGVWEPGNGGLGMGKVLDAIHVDYKPIANTEKE